MLRSLEVLHDNGILHRDVKPGNFCIGTGKLAREVYVIDFGLSRRYVGNGGEVREVCGISLFTFLFNCNRDCVLNDNPLLYSLVPRLGSAVLLVTPRLTLTWGKN